MIWFNTNQRQTNKIYYLQSDITAENRQSSIFLSKSKRFALSSKQPSPGPGEYQIPSKDRGNNLFDKETTSKYRSKNLNQNQLSRKNLQYMWLIEPIRGENRANLYSRNIGPGSYNLDSKQKSSQEKNTFGVDKRFHTIQQKYPKIGPGSYHIQREKQKKGIVSSFVSKSKRFNNDKDDENSDIRLMTNHSKSMQMKIFNPESDLQTFMKNSLIQERPQFQNELNYKNSFNNNVDKKSYVFKSRIPRFQQPKSQKIGPGIYQLNNLNKSEISVYHKQKKRGRIRKTKLQENQSLPFPSQPFKIQYGQTQINDLGQLNYNALEYSLKKRNSSMARETRFNFKQSSKSKKQILPGPGHYHQNKFSFIDRDSYLKQIDSQKASPNQSHNILALLSKARIQKNVLKRSISNIQNIMTEKVKQSNYDTYFKIDNNQQQFNKLTIFQRNQIEANPQYSNQF